jgi:asparagine synthase (glutamine-hydrolysing)
MCGIFAYLDVLGDDHALALARRSALTQARLIRHRGPDRTGVAVCGRHVLAHERLAIVDPASGSQPMHDGGGLVLAANGEIYNHETLRGDFPRWPFTSASDCEVLLPLYRAHGAELVHHLKGMFAFVIADAETGGWLIARDHLGIIPLYVGRTDDGRLAVASEMKALSDVCTHVQEFPPGHVQTERDRAPRRWYTPPWRDPRAGNVRAAAEPLREALVAAVGSHLMTDVPFGVLLSGGLDSSLIAAIAARLSRQRTVATGAPRLDAFSVGLADSPDLAAAAAVARAVDVSHHALTFTAEEGIDALRDAIWHTETFEVTTIRAAVPMMLLARFIRSLGIKMVLSGEGADELFGGYRYFYHAPDATAFHEELVRKLDQLHFYDCLRANKAMAAWGVEARVPFLDVAFVEAAMSIHADDKRPSPKRMEKHALREAFSGWLPDDLLWRRKEQFSDGVGYAWADALRAHAEREVTDRQLAEASERFPLRPPRTKEGYLYRSLFTELFPLASAVACVPEALHGACATSAALAWNPAIGARSDPSGRAVHV